MNGVTASVEDGSALESRVTVTRLLLAGPFALAFKKKKGGEKFVTIEGPGFAWIAEANRKHIKEAVTFANSVRNQVAKNSASLISESDSQVPSALQQTAGDVTNELIKLAQLHDAGVLSDNEFDAAKKRMLGL